MVIANSLVNLGDLSKPATVLIEKISCAVGGVFKPFQIVRVARAEAEAERIGAESRIQVSDLQRRAFHRMLEEEAKKQQNIEDITRQALPLLEEKSRPEEVENDWITNFFDKCRLISDTEMQSLWSRILAGEANAPGSYGKRTVNLVSSLDRSDARLFTSLCSFVWMIQGIVPVVYDSQAELYQKAGISFGTLTHLDSIGLIQFDAIMTYTRIQLPKHFTVYYFGAPSTLEFEKQSGNEMLLGHVILTRVGQELERICGSQPNSDFREYILKKWAEMKYIKDVKAE